MKTIHLRAPIKHGAHKSKPTLAILLSVFSILGIAFSPICTGAEPVMQEQNLKTYLVRANSCGYRLGKQMGQGLLEMVGHGKKIPSSKEELEMFAHNFWNYRDSTDPVNESVWVGERQEIKNIRAAVGADNFNGPIKREWIAGFLQGVVEILKSA